MAYFMDQSLILSGLICAVSLAIGYGVARTLGSRRLDVLLLDHTYLQKQHSALHQSFNSSESALNACREQLSQMRAQKEVAEERARLFEPYGARAEQLQTALGDAECKYAELFASLQKERQGFEEKIILITAAQKKMEDAFKAISYEALEKNNHNFLSLARQSFEKLQESAKGDMGLKEKAIMEMVAPLKESLKGVDQKLFELEKERGSAYQVLRHQVNDMILSQKELKSETANLVRALRTPHVRGRWGEMQLKRVAEISGMSAYCDFVEQSHQVIETRAIRPDMIVNLPEGKRIIVDAKAPLQAYLESLEAKSDEERLELLKAHARQVKAHITALSSKTYWDQFKCGETPEFVVLFLPGETFFSAALEQESSLIEIAAEKKVILATPTTLIALLQAIAYGWRQERIAKNTQEISQLGRELYKRLFDVSKHLSKLGQDLTASVNSYNRTIGTFETRFLPSARRFRELGVGNNDQSIAFQTADAITRQPTAPELRLEESPELLEDTPVILKNIK
jgi:DNA recombination protein RmuC